MGRAEISKDMGHADDSLRVYHECIEKYPMDTVSRNGEAAALSHFGRLDEALQAYDSMLSNHLLDVVTLTGRSQVLREQGQLEASLAALDVVIQTYPDSKIALHMRGEVLRELGRAEEALYVFSDLRKRSPNNIEAQLSYARTLRDQGQFDAAIAEFTKIKTSNLLNPLGTIGLAETYKRLSRTTDAIKLYDEVLSRFSRMTSARNGKAGILASQGRYEEALSLLPTHAPAMLNEWVAFHIRGMIYMRSGELERAQSVFEHGIGNNPWGSQRDYFLTALASLRLRQQRYAEVAPLTRAVTYSTLEPVARVLTLHALGAMKDEQQFHSVFSTIQKTSGPIILELQREIASLYSLGKGYIKTEEWIIRREWDALLLAA